MSVLEVLKKARTVYAKTGHAPNPQKAYALSDKGETVHPTDARVATVCLLGAVLQVCGGTGFQSKDTPAVAKEARALLYKAGFSMDEHDRSTVQKQLPYFHKAIQLAEGKA